MPNVCTVTGPLRSPDGSLLADTKITFWRDLGARGQDGATVIPREIEAVSDGSGAISVDLYPGKYRLLTAGNKGEIISVAVGVPDEATANLHDIISQVPEITSSVLTQAIEARDAAIAAQAAAEAAIGAASINAQTVDYTLVSGDAGKLVTVNAATAKTVTIPADATAEWATNVVISIMRLGAGEVNIQAAAGVDLNGVTAGGTAISETYGLAQLIRLGADAWAIAGLTDGVTA